MPNEIQTMAQQTLGQLPAALRAKLQQGVKINQDLAAGITSGFAVISVRGKVFRIKHQGDERALVNEDRSPQSALDVVIVKASPNIAKIFYIDGYEEGSNAPPDCWSVDGVKPDPASPQRQADFCAGCPQNAWGSASRNGRPSKGKACQDSKRLAAVPGGNIPNEMYGGPMLIRVPPDSLGELRAYAERLNAMGFPVEAVVTRITFDIDTPHPKMLFREVRALSDEEYAEVEKHLKGEVVNRILNTAIDHVQTDGDVSKPAHPPAAGGKPMQKPQEAPAGFVPTVVGGTAQSGIYPAPSAPSPAMASAERVAEVAQKVATGDPNAEKRADLRKLGFPEEQIEALLGPEPKPEPKPEPVDPRVAKLKEMGFSDEEIAKVTGGAPATPVTAPVTPPGNVPPVANGTRKRRTKAEMQAARAAEAAATASQKPQENGFALQTEMPLTGEVLPPGGQDEEKTGDLPEGFEGKLDALLGLK